jgi:hypothetical protein
MFDVRWARTQPVHNHPNKLKEINRSIVNSEKKYRQ